MPGSTDNAYSSQISSTHGGKLSHGYSSDKTEPDATMSGDESGCKIRTVQNDPSSNDSVDRTLGAWRSLGQFEMPDESSSERSILRGHSQHNPANSRLDIPGRIVMTTEVTVRSEAIERQV
jgi:SpoVK/Ycf46/Vps4 family AAA+-type ATPase